MIKIIIGIIIIFFVILWIQAGRDVQKKANNYKQRLAKLELNGREHGTFHEGLIPVNNSSSGRRWGLMNEQGVWIVPPKYDYINWSNKRGGCWECVSSIGHTPAEYFDIHGTKSFSDFKYIQFARQEKIREENERQYEIRKHEEFLYQQAQERAEQTRLHEIKSNAMCSECKHNEHYGDLIIYSACSLHRNKTNTIFEEFFEHPQYCEDFEPKD